MADQTRRPVLYRLSASALERFRLPWQSTALMCTLALVCAPFPGLLAHSALGVLSLSFLQKGCQPSYTFVIDASRVADDSWLDEDHVLGYAPMGGQDQVSAISDMIEGT